LKRKINGRSTDGNCKNCVGSAQVKEECARRSVGGGNAGEIRRNAGLWKIRDSRKDSSVIRG